MLKEIIISIVIIVFVVIGNFITQNYTVEATQNLTDSIYNLKEKISKDINNEETKKCVDEVENLWKSKYDKLAYFIEHNELEKVETNLTGVKSFIETAEYSDAICELEKMNFLLEHIKDKYAINLENIF